MTPKKIPMRQCTGCREMKPKKELIRVVKSPDGEISIDFKGKKPGRGAYICPDMACFKKVKKSKVLSKTFDIEIPDEIYEELERQMAENKGE